LSIPKLTVTIINFAKSPISELLFAGIVNNNNKYRLIQFVVRMYSRLYHGIS